MTSTPGGFGFGANKIAGAVDVLGSRMNEYTSDTADNWAVTMKIVKGWPRVKDQKKELDEENDTQLRLFNRDD